MSKKNRSSSLATESENEILEIDKKTYKSLQASLDNKHSLYVACKEREYEAVQQKQIAMETLKKVSVRCHELTIQNQRGKIDNVDFDKKRLDGEELEKHVKTKYELSDSKKSFDDEIEKVLYVLHGNTYKLNKF